MKTKVEFYETYFINHSLRMHDADSMPHGYRGSGG